MAEPARFVSASVWIGTLVLALVGVTAGVFRAAHVADAGARAEPARERILQAFGAVDPGIAERPAEVRRFDSRFAERPVLTLTHVVAGALFLAFAPLQFCFRLRNRYRRLHRWSGRVLLCTLLVSTVPALYFGLRVPFAGGAEALTIATVAALLLVAAARAFVAIRRGDVAGHREWMLRAFALALGIGSVRVVGAGLDVALAPLGVPPATVFLVALWIGWPLAAAAAELWILHTRAPARDAAIAGAEAGEVMARNEVA